MKSPEYVPIEALNSAPTGPHVPAAEREDALRDALRGVDLGGHDELVVGYLARHLDQPTMRTLVSLVERARGAGMVDPLLPCPNGSIASQQEKAIHVSTIPGNFPQMSPEQPPAGPPQFEQPFNYQWPGTPEPPVKRTNRRNWIVLSVVVVVSFVLLAVVLALAAPPKRQLATITPPAATSAPVVAAPITKAPAANPTTAMRAWIDDGGGTLTNALLGDFQAASTAGTAMDVRGLHAAYLSLQRDVEKAQAFRPIPDAGAQQEWAAALAAYARCATNGLTATRGGTVMSVDAQLLNESTADLDEGGTHLVKLTALITAYTK
jgi:hypothetical protein